MLLNQIEEDLLNEFDKLIDFYEEHNPDQTSITVTEKQWKKFERISKKTQGEVYRRIGELNLKDGKYRGYEVFTVKMRRSRKKKDTIDMFKE